MFFFYLPALHFLVPSHQQLVFEVAHLLLRSLPSRSQGRLPAETRVRRSDNYHTLRSGQIWHPDTDTHTAAPLNTFYTPTCLCSLSLSSWAAGVFLLLQITGNPIRPVHDLMSTLMSINVDTRRPPQCLHLIISTPLLLIKDQWYVGERPAPVFFFFLLFEPHTLKHVLTGAGTACLTTQLQVSQESVSEQWDGDSDMEVCSLPSGGIVSVPLTHKHTLSQG